MRNHHPLKSSVREFYSMRAAYYDAVGKQLLESHDALMWLKDTFTLCKMIRKDANSHILDIASGTGAVALWLARKYRAVACLDITSKMLRRALENAEKIAPETMEFVCGDVENSPFNDAEFDVITCQRAFHYFPTPEKAVSEMHRILRPNGQVVIGSVVFPQEERTARFYDRIFRTLNKAYYRYYSLDEFNQLFQEQNLSSFVHENSSKYISFDNLIMTWTDLRPGSTDELKSYRDMLMQVIATSEASVRESCGVTADALQLDYSVMSWTKT